MKRLKTQWVYTRSRGVEDGPFLKPFDLSGQAVLN